MRSVQKLAIILGSGFALASQSAALTQAQPAKAAPAYVVLEFNIKDAEGFRDYAQRSPATVALHGGKFLVRPGKIVTLTGDAPKGAFAVLAFDNAEQAQKWASSPEYTALVPLRDRSAEARIFVVEGVAP
jgi:uncharacterized protein (DUF1330 family)